MDNPSSIWDRPVTDKELDQFYGREVTESEIRDAIARQAAAFDANDLTEVVAENAVLILAYLQGEYFEDIGRAIDRQKRETIARRASIELYGRVGVIQASQVLV